MITAMPGSNIIIEIVMKSFLLLTKTLQLFRRKSKATERNTDSEAVEIAKGANIAHLPVLGPP